MLKSSTFVKYIAAAFLLVRGTANAADLASSPDVPPAVKQAQRPWQVRLRGLYVAPDFSTRPVTANGAVIPGAGVGVTGIEC